MPRPHTSESMIAFYGPAIKAGLLAGKKLACLAYEQHLTLSSTQRIANALGLHITWTTPEERDLLKSRRLNP